MTANLLLCWHRLSASWPTEDLGWISALIMRFWSWTWGFVLGGWISVTKREFHPWFRSLPWWYIKWCFAYSLVAPVCPSFGVLSLVGIFRSPDVSSSVFHQRTRPWFHTLKWFFCWQTYQHWSTMQLPPRWLQVSPMAAHGCLEWDCPNWKGVVNLALKQAMVMKAFQCRPRYRNIWDQKMALMGCSLGEWLGKCANF